MFFIYSVKRGHVVLWVGATSNLEHRSKNHRVRFGHDIEIKKLARCKSPEKAKKLERYWIEQLNPTENKMRAGGPIQEPGFGSAKKRKIRKTQTESKPKLKRRARRCIAINNDGKRCARKPLERTDRCSLHPETKRIKRDGRRAVNISLSAEGRARLTMLAAELGVSRSELIEQWIEGAPWPKRKDDETGSTT